MSHPTAWTWCMRCLRGFSYTRLAGCGAPVFCSLACTKEAARD